MESNLSDEDLKKNLTNAAIKTMMTVEGAEPIGLYLITVEESRAAPFPVVPVEKLTSDLHMDRLREFDKERKEDEMWNDQM